MVSEQREFWSRVAQQYDQIVDLQIGPKIRSMVLDRVLKEGRLGKLAEFGCGTGFYTEALASKADTVMATDLALGMLTFAKAKIRAANVSFQAEDIQNTSFPDQAFDTVFMSLVIHFAEPGRALAEMHRILRPGGVLIISNLDPGALSGLDRIRCLIRVISQGLIGYHTKPPKGFGRNVMTEKQLCDLLSRTGFEVNSSETIKDSSRSSNIPVEYIKAVRN